MKKKILIFPLLLLLSSAPALAGFTPQGERYESGKYLLSDFVIALLNIYNFIVATAGSLALLAFIYGGFVLLISSGNSELVTKGKKALISATVGIFITLFAFTIVDFSLKGIGYNVERMGLWYTLKEVEAPIVAEVVAEEAGVIINNGKIALSTSADCGGNFNAKGTMEEIAQTGMATACSPSCDCTTKVAVNQAMLTATDNVGKNHSITVTSITTGRHAANSDHYKGRGIDVVSNGGSNEWQQIMNEYKSAGATKAYFEYREGGKTYYLDHVDPSKMGAQAVHLHFSF